MSLCFVGKNDYLIALDSHPHNLQGAMVAQTKMGNREELLNALKLLLSPQFNTCSLRNGPDKNDSNNGNEHVGMQKRC